MNTILSGAAVFAAIVLLATPTVNASDCNGTGPKLTTACGSTLKNNCHNKCYCTYEEYVCKNPTPGGLSKHKKELHQCQETCKLQSEADHPINGKVPTPQ